MSDKRFAPWPSYTPAELEAVQKVLQSNKVNYWTGQEGREFEKEFSTFSGCQFAIALSNGTVALELALEALGIGPGDEVVVTPRTFLASVSCVARAGAVPVFADVDIHSQNITAETIGAVLSKKTRAILCVHLAGWPCDMDTILALAREHDLAVIEDCAQAHGAKYKGRSVGSFGDIGAWSFCQDKIITTGGEGGMVTTNDRNLWSTMWSAKDHGKSYAAVYEREHPAGFRWLHESFGTNGRMTEVQATLGRLQLSYMPNWHRRRLEIANVIWQAAREFVGLRVPDIPSFIEHAAYKCCLFTRPNALKSGWDRDRIMAEINALGVPCYSGSCPEVYLEKAFDGTGFRPDERLPNARELGETSLMFLCHPTLTDDEVAKTCEALDTVMHRATR